MAKMATSSSPHLSGFGTLQSASTLTSACGRLYVKYLVWFMTALGITLYFLAMPIRSAFRLSSLLFPLHGSFAQPARQSKFLAWP